MKANYQCKTLKHNFIALNTSRGINNLPYPSLKKEKFATISKVKIKWKTIKSLMENEKAMIERLIIFNKKLKKMNPDMDQGNNRKEFYQLMN